VCCEHVLDGQVEQRAQPLDDLLPRHVFVQPPRIDFEPAAEIDERVAGDDRPVARDPEHRVVLLLPRKYLDTDVQPVARRVRASLADPLFQEPDDVGGAVARLLGGEAPLPHEVLGGVGHRRVDRGSKPLHEASGVALVPRARQDDRCRSVAREPLDLARRGDRVEEQQALAVVDRIGRDLRPPRLARFPFRVRRLPVPQAGSQLAHAVILVGGQAFSIPSANRGNRA